MYPRRASLKAALAALSLAPLHSASAAQRFGSGLQDREAVVKVNSDGGMKVRALTRTEKQGAVGPQSLHEEVPKDKVALFTKHEGQNCVGSRKNVMSKWEGTVLECGNMCAGLTYCEGFEHRISGTGSGTCDFLAGMVELEDAEDQENSNITSDCYSLNNPYLSNTTMKDERLSDFIKYKHKSCSGTSASLLTNYDGAVADCQNLCRNVLHCAGFMRNHETGKCTLLQGDLVVGQKDEAHNCFKYKAPPEKEQSTLPKKISCHMCIPSEAKLGSTSKEHDFRGDPKFIRAIDVVPPNSTKIDTLSFYCFDECTITVQPAIYSETKLLAKGTAETVHCQPGVWKDQHLEDEITLVGHETYYLAQLHTAGISWLARGTGDMNVKSPYSHFVSAGEELPSEAPKWHKMMGMKNYWHAGLAFTAHHSCGTKLDAKHTTASGLAESNGTSALHCKHHSQ